MSTLEWWARLEALECTYWPSFRCSILILMSFINTQLRSEQLLSLSLNPGERAPATAVSNKLIKHILLKNFRQTRLERYDDWQLLNKYKCDFSNRNSWVYIFKWRKRYQGFKNILISHVDLCWTLIGFFWFEDSLGEHHEKVDWAHDEDTSPEPDNSDDDWLEKRDNDNIYQDVVSHLSWMCDVSPHTCHMCPPQQQCLLSQDEISKIFLILPWNLCSIWSSLIPLNSLNLIHLHYHPQLPLILHSQCFHNPPQQNLRYQHQHNERCSAGNTVPISESNILLLFSPFKYLCRNQRHNSEQ